jgi:hypothetical protein
VGRESSSTRSSFRTKGFISGYKVSLPKNNLIPRRVNSSLQISHPMGNTTTIAMLYEGLAPNGFVGQDRVSTPVARAPSLSRTRGSRIRRVQLIRFPSLADLARRGPNEENVIGAAVITSDARYGTRGCIDRDSTWTSSLKLSRLESG